MLVFDLVDHASVLVLGSDDVLECLHFSGDNILDGEDGAGGPEPEPFDDFVSVKGRWGGGAQGDAFCCDVGHCF